ncbi:MAG: class I SAM-dependent methyltransferase [Myxococcales bacterium]|nr:class I SAM-dependent methyltransferase [Myxococcales bacterium]MCB9693901.1 class I SAM-dependent methyltransferase [Alphaproteobacteria bacterium]
MIERHDLGATTILFDPLTGRGRQGALPVSWAVPDVLAGVWCRNRCTLTVPEGLWAPDPTRSGPDGHPYRAVPLTDDERAVWAAVNDARTGADLAARSGVLPAVVERLASRLTAFDVQALQIRPQAARAGDPGLRRVLGVPRPPNLRTADQHDARGATTLGHWHEASITDGPTHFDDRETTFAHAFGLPHPALDGERYGARLRRVLAERGWATDGPVVEVGCGTGELASAWGPVDGRYLRIDLSPELLRVQALAAPFSEGLRGDLCALPLPDGSVPLLLCNEVLADLEAVPVGDPDAERLREELGLPALSGGWYNTGSWRAVQEAARVLAPGGHAVFTEFGVVDGEVEEATQLDHPEVGVHFGHLAVLAGRLGLTAEVVRLDDLVRPSRTETWLARHSWRAVRSWASSRGVRLPARAWTPRTLRDALPAAVDGLDWVALTDEGPGPLVTRFWVLLLEARGAG